MNQNIYERTKSNKSIIKNLTNIYRRKNVFF